MKQFDQNRLTTWRAVRQFLDATTGIWSGNAPFVHASDMLTHALSEARSTLFAQASLSTGISSKKDALENEAVRQTVAIARCAKIFAMDTANVELREAVDHGKAKLLRLPQNELVARLRAIVGAAQDYSEVLKEYGVHWEAYERALEVIAEMEDTQSSVRTAIKRKKAVTSVLPAIMNEGQEALMRMDNLVHVFERDNPKFVAEYKAIRVMVHSGSRHKDDDATSAA